MKSAKEMFEELGYSCKEDDDYIEYIQKIEDCTYEIAFDYNTKFIEFYSYRGNFEKKLDSNLYITLKSILQGQELLEILDKEVN